jgi:hypothetical protein
MLKSNMITSFPRLRFRTAAILEWERFEPHSFRLIGKRKHIVVDQEENIKNYKIKPLLMIEQWKLRNH